MKSTLLSLLNKRNIVTYKNSINNSDSDKKSGSDSGNDSNKNSNSNIEGTSAKILYIQHKQNMLVNRKTTKA